MIDEGSDTQIEQIEYIPLEKHLVEAADLILDTAKKNGSKGVVQTDLDWATIQVIYKTWSILFPEEYQMLLSQVDFLRTYSKEGGVSKEGSSQVGHKLTIPRHLHDFISTIFDKQKWTDKKFLKRLLKELPQLKPYE